MPFQRVIVAVLAIAGLHTAVLAADTPLVSVGPDGKLAYTPDAQGNVIPDFSTCGYHGGGVALPREADIPVRVTLTPMPGEGDDTARIQAAIDQVSKLKPDAKDIRGAVLLTRGTYRIAKSLVIAAGGVVLRGEGSTETGTTLIATGTAKRDLISTHAPTNPNFNEDAEADNRPARSAAARGKSWKVADSYVPVGAKTITLENTAGLSVGDVVVVHRPSTQNWIHFLKMDQIPPAANGTTKQWTPGSKDLDFERTITAIAANTITLDAPIVCALDSQYGGGDVHLYTGPRRLREVGIEHLRGVSEFKGNTDEDHAWTFLQISNLEDGWVRDITAEHFAYAAVGLGGGAKWCTVQDSQCLDPISQITGGRRYSFNMNHCSQCLVQRCFARNGRHDFVMGATVPGPNVFLQCTAEKTHADAGPHHRWSVGVLYDSLSLPDGEINMRDRGNSGTGHGWAGANQVAWNCTARAMIIQNPPTAQNWAIGCTVQKHTGDGVWLSINQPVQPTSLYLAQLKDRLGAQAVANISKP